MKMKIFSLFFLGLMLGEFDLRIEAKLFNNMVQLPPKLSVYKFNLEITHGLSMSVWNDRRKTYDPVLQDSKSGSFYLRNYSYNANTNPTANCQSKTIIADTSLINSIITLGGIHREMLLINRQFPGQPIVVPQNAKVEITVKNSLMSESVSLHWHGQIQKNTFYMDGVSRVTQCPIGPGETFTYKFTASEVGTHW
jgi:FtsP/CotA-like multicopper oxidase with cupredoxin domain